MLKREHDREACRLAEAVATMVSAGYLREAILLRLAVGQVRLKRSISLSLRDVIVCDPEPEPQHWVHSAGRHFDRFCTQAGAQPLAFLVLKYVLRFRLPLQGAQHDSDLELPLFASRKGGGPITPRTAERLLRRVCKRCCLRDAVSFRDAKTLGKRLIEAGVAKRSCAFGVDQILAASDRINWFYAQLFPNDAHERRDAKQAGVLALLRTMQDRGLSSLNDDYAKAILFRAGRAYHAQYARRRHREVSGILGDWSQVADPPTDVATRAVRAALHARVRRALRTLSQRERFIIEHRFGLIDGYTYTLAEVGYIFRVSPERVRQIEANAMRKLRMPAVAQHLVGFFQDAR